MNASPHTRALRLWRLGSDVVFHAALIACVVAIFAILLFGLNAHAQTTDVLTPAPLEIDPANTALVVLDGIKNGQWWIVAAGIVSLLTWGVRSGILKRLPGKAGAFFTTSPIAGYVIPFVLSGIGGAFTTWASGMPFTWGSLIGEVLKVGLGAIGLFIGKKTIEESRELKAAKVETQVQANAELLKP